MPKRSQHEIVAQQDELQNEELLASSPTTLSAQEMQGITHHNRADANSMHRVRKDLATCPTTSSMSQAYSRKVLRHAYTSPLDRVNVLGDDKEYGHRGCVNALSWALDGDVLISGGDDLTLRLWRLDSTDTTTPYPYKETAIIDTGHRGNIFNAHLLPSSSRIASVAGDGQVRVFDAEHALLSTERSSKFTERQTCIRVLKCHKKRTKRIITEESPDAFLTVAEDGAVIQHDLRTSHRCDRDRDTCPPPLVKLPFDLSSIALSPLAPHLFVVAGESAHGYLFDRRQVGRSLQAEWGIVCDDESYVTCVRRFGRPVGVEEGEREGQRYRSDHITGARMAQTNAHEVLLSYSGDAVYLYSTNDEAQESIGSSSVLPSNGKSMRDKSSAENVQSHSSLEDQSDDDYASMSDSGSFPELIDLEMAEDGSDEDDTDDSSVDDMPVASRPIDLKFKTPAILPRRAFRGHCNVETVKDVNFVGVEDEYVASGSDDGNFFLWDKDTGQLHGIYEGDGSVVNVIENHPRLPLIACSGIDTTVKLFAPTQGRSAFSRMEKSEQIINQNASNSSRLKMDQIRVSSLLARYRHALQRVGEDDSDEESEERQSCTFQ